MVSFARTNLPDLVADSIMRKIKDNYWQIGDKLPSESKLSEEYNVNRLTVRLAINKLNTIGVLETIAGKGTYVKEFSLYNYLNQIVPYIISSKEISYILEFENMLLNNTSISKEAEKQVRIKISELDEIVSVTNFKVHSIDENIESNKIIVRLITDINKCIIECNDNELMKTLYKSLSDAIYNNLYDELLDKNVGKIIKYVKNYIKDILNIIN